MRIFSGYFKELTLQALLLGVATILFLYAVIGLGAYGVWMLLRGSPSPDDRTAFLILCTTFVMNIAALAFLLYSRWEWRQNRREARGIITGSNFDQIETEVEDRDANNNVTYRKNVDTLLKVKYEFEGPDGKKREGWILGQWTLDTRKTQQELARMYMVNAPVSVWYHVNDPDFNTLDPYPKQASLNTVVAYCIVCVILCGYGCGFHRINQWYATRPPPVSSDAD
jgi:hypothetical protein